MHQSTLGAPTAQLNSLATVGSNAVNPTADDILVTSGQLPAGDYNIQIQCHSTVDTYMEIVHRNAANSADVWNYELPMAADTDIPFILAGKITLVTNERILVRARDSETGTLQAAMWLNKISG